MLKSFEDGKLGVARPTLFCSDPVGGTQYSGGLLS